MKAFLLFFLTVAGIIPAQIILPPHLIADTLSLSKEFKDFSYYKGELDFDGDGKNEIIVYNYSDSISNFKIYNSNFSLLKQFEAASAKEKFALGYEKIINKGKKSDLFIPYFARSKIKFFIYSRVGEQIVEKEIYSLPHSSSMKCYFRTFVAGEYLIVGLNIIYPNKKEYRQIFAFDISENYKFKWVIKTADYISRFFYSKKFPDRFFYASLGFSNRHYHIYSHKTFYRIVKNTKKVFIDTTFTTKSFPQPDTTAPDYSTDRVSSLVVCSIKGRYIKRIKLENMTLKNVTVANDSLFLFSFTKRAKNKRIVLLKFNPRNFGLKEIAGYPFGKYSLHLIGPSVFVKQKNKITRFLFNGNKLIQKNNILLNRNACVLFSIVKVKDYYFFLCGHDVLVADSLLNLVGSTHIGGFSNITFSTALNAFVLRRIDQAWVFRLRQADIFERISPYFLNVFIKIIIVLLIFVTILWMLTMLKSRKLIKLQNQELREKQEILEKATAELVHAEKLALLGTIAASFAHQLNSPIGAIKNSAERLSKKVEDENLDLILRSVEYTKTIVGKFLYASRPPDNDELACVEFPEVWENWFSLFGREFAQAGIEIKLDVQENSCVTSIQREHLFEIISNIMFNAKDAILDSGKEEKYIKIKVFASGENCEFHFSDSGGGAPEEIAKNIFSPFVTSKEKGKGTGLGLWITKRLVDRAGGQISFENTSEGALFKIILPKCKNKGE